MPADPTRSIDAPPALLASEDVLDAARDAIHDEMARGQMHGAMPTYSDLARVALTALHERGWILVEKGAIDAEWTIETQDAVQALLGVLNHVGGGHPWNYNVITEAAEEALKAAMVHLLPPGTTRWEGRQVLGWVDETRAENELLRAERNELIRVLESIAPYATADAVDSMVNSLGNVAVAALTALKGESDA